MLVISGVTCRLNEIWIGKKYRGLWLACSLGFKVPVSGERLVLCPQDDKDKAVESMARMIADYRILNGVC